MKWTVEELCGTDGVKNDMSGEDRIHRMNVSLHTQLHSDGCGHTEHKEIHGGGGGGGGELAGEGTSIL